MFNWMITNMDAIIACLGGLSLGLLIGYVINSKADKENTQYANTIIEYYRVKIYELEEKLGKYKIGGY